MLEDLKEVYLGEVRRCPPGQYPHGTVITVEPCTAFGHEFEDKPVFEERMSAEQRHEFAEKMCTTWRAWAETGE